MKVDDVPMVCINLERRPDRWAKVQTMARAADIKIDRLEAVDAKTFVAHEHPAITLGTAHNIYYKVRRSHYEIDAGGAIGASLSHFKAWTRAKGSSAPALVIFEDDIVLPPDFKERLGRVFDDLKTTDWDVIQLQVTRYTNGGIGAKPIKGSEPWHSVDSLMGAHAYVVSRRGAERLLARAYPIELHVDAYLAYMARMGHIKMLWHPALDIDQGTSKSDIGHGDCEICNVPTNMEKAGVVVLPIISVVGMMAMASFVGGAIALAYWPRR